ncbi:hypothetical protein LZD49_32270 [Dyadobacter sp. CY261]|uniref:hypothetical protein n=1 Tax=Dyadobacter sp. CY261 TaxID=2907203 RepID=UPI001F2FA149|nr:hypothetical protein [Dyadobacter sp. CY261]MCF0075203.1 hypothetical protein [Dyadobacter sp. CY261]
MDKIIRNIYYFGALADGFKVYPNHTGVDNIFSTYYNNSETDWFVLANNTQKSVFYTYVRYGILTSVANGRTGSCFGIAIEFEDCYFSDFEIFKASIIDKVIEILLKEGVLLSRVSDLIAFKPYNLTEVSKYLDGMTLRIEEFIRGKYLAYLIPKDNVEKVGGKKIIGVNDQTPNDVVSGLFTRYGSVKLSPKIPLEIKSSTGGKDPSTEINAVENNIDQLLETNQQLIESHSELRESQDKLHEYNNQLRKEIDLLKLQINNYGRIIEKLELDQEGAAGKGGKKKRRQDSSVSENAIGEGSGMGLEDSSKDTLTNVVTSPNEDSEGQSQNGSSVLAKFVDELVVFASQIRAGLLHKRKPDAVVNGEVAKKHQRLPIIPFIFGLLVILILWILTAPIFSETDKVEEDEFVQQSEYGSSPQSQNGAELDSCDFDISQDSQEYRYTGNRYKSTDSLAFAIAKLSNRNDCGNWISGLKKMLEETNGNDIVNGEIKRSGNIVFYLPHTTQLSVNRGFSKGK